MKQLKLFICALSCMLYMAQNANATDYYDLYLQSTSGSLTRLDYANLRSITFEMVRESGTTTYVNMMHVNSYDGSTSSYSLEDAECLIFMDVTVGVNDVNESEVPGAFILQNGKVQAAEQGVASVYQMDGRRVSNQSVQQGEVINIDNGVSGTYLVHLNGQTIKMVKK